MRIYTYEGKDRITVNDGNVLTIEAGKDSDRIIINDGTVFKIKADTGNDKVIINGGNITSVDLGKGKNTIEISGGTVGKILGSSEADVITVAKQKKVDITASYGNNKITVTGINDSTKAAAVSKGVITSKSGDDTITINNGGFYKIYTGAGGDKIEINGGSHIIKTEDGDDSIYINSNRSNQADAGSGNDTITLNGSTTHNKIVGGKGDDTFHINNTNLNLIEGGTGNDTYNVASVHGETLINNSSAGKHDLDVLNITGKKSDVYNHKHLFCDKQRDILKCNDIYIKGFKRLSKINVLDGNSTYTFSAKSLIDESSSRKFDNFNSELKIFNNNLDTIKNKGVITNSLARFAGYDKK